MTEKKEFVTVRVSPKIARDIRALEDGELQELKVLEYLDQSKRDVKDNVECLDEDLIQYKATMINMKQKFKAAKEEQLDASYALWEKFDEELPSLEKKARIYAQKLTPIRDMLKEIDSLLRTVHTYNLENFVKLLNEISNSSNQTKSWLQFLASNHKPSE